MALIGQQHAQRREMRGEERDDDLGDIELAGDGHDMQGSSAARGHQREIAGIVTLFDGDLAHGERHLQHADVHDGLGGRDHIHAQRAGNDALDACAGALRIELHRAAQEIVGVETAQHHIGVGDGGLRAPAAIADGAGRCARAGGANLQGADLVDPGDGAAAGAHFHHIDHREHHGMAAGVAAHIIAGREGGVAILDEARLGGGAAHVEGDHVRDAERLPEARGGDDAAHGA